jgi:eukaryotic-like serine/threonine-protein kinase
VNSSDPTGRLTSEPPTRPISGAEASATTRAMPAEGAVARAGGLVLGRYRLEDRLGAGGFGVVWRARDEHLEREVAVKAIARGADGPKGVDDRAFREARAAARLNHPGIVALYEMGEDEESVYLVSELVHGRTFAELERAGALADRDVARIGAALAVALEHAHARGVIHRDVKPGNVIVVAEPSAGAGFAKLTDFGVAHLVGDDPLTRTGDVVGTLAYMSPEQAEGRRPTGACDVYSLALTLFEGLAGENPVRGRSPAETARLVGRRPPPLRSYRRDLPHDVCAVLDACLDPRPERRAPLDELGDVLGEAASELDTDGGLVEAETLARVGLLPRATPGGDPRRSPGREPADERPPRPPPAAPPMAPPANARVEPAPATAEPRSAAPPPAAPFGDRAARPIPAPGHGWGEEPARRPLLVRLGPRLAAGLAAGGLTAAALAIPATAPPVGVLSAAAGVAGATALLPRIAWLVAAVGVLGWLALGAGLAGAALLALPPVAVTPLLLPRAGRGWSLPALAPLLGAASLAPAFLGLAGLARTPLRRAGLGAAGALWLAAAEAITGEQLLFAAPPAVPDPSLWTGSLTAAATEALPPYLTTPALAPALLWALFAAILPLAVRGRSLGLDLARGALWAGALIATQAALPEALGLAGGAAEARGAVLGPVVALALALPAASLRAGFGLPVSGPSESARARAVERPFVA